MHNLIKGFVNFNIRISNALTPDWIHKIHAYSMYTLQGKILMLSPEVRTVLDVGAGKQWQFPHNLKDEAQLYLIGLDIDASEMDQNHLLDEKIEGDESLDGIDTSSIDLICCQAVVEHIEDNQKFVDACMRVLKPGGKLIVTFANRYAPYAIVNRLLPVSWSAVLLRYLVPGSDGILGFKTYYNKCGYHEFRKLLEDSGFVVTNQYCSFYGSRYYRFFTPLYLLSLAFDYLRMFLNVKSLSSYNLYIAEKPAQ